MAKKQTYFQFCFQGEPDRVFGFLLPALDDDDVQALYDEMTEYSDTAGLEEQYGVHDIAGDVSDVTESLGFTTYEVEPGRITSLMKAWHEFFVKKFGNQAVGGVLEFPSALTNVDARAALLRKKNSGDTPAPQP